MLDLKNSSAAVDAMKKALTEPTPLLNTARQVLRKADLPTKDKKDSFIAFTGHSTVTDFARFLGLSTSFPRARAVW